MMTLRFHGERIFVSHLCLVWRILATFLRSLRSALTPRNDGEPYPASCAVRLDLCDPGQAVRSEPASAAAPSAEIAVARNLAGGRGSGRRHRYCNPTSGVIAYMRRFGSARRFRSRRQDAVPWIAVSQHRIPFRPRPNRPVRPECPEIVAVAVRAVSHR